MKTPVIKGSMLTRKWFVVDASEAIVGRLASEIAKILRGKHKAAYTPHLDNGDFVVVTNCEKVRFTGKKETDKKYWRYTGFPGGERFVTPETQRGKFPERILIAAVKGMLPKGPLGRQMVKKLKVYAGEKHPHEAQSPESIKFEI